MEKERGKRRAGAHSRTLAGALALLLIMCLVECTSEQRINSRGSKSSNLIDKANGYRSQRGGSCLSYGHSCWGAHGKRSAKPPSTAPDWFLTKLLKRMDAGDFRRDRQLDARSDDINALFRMDTAGDSAPEDRVSEEGEVAQLEPGRDPGKPMLDDNMLNKIKFWQLMKQLSGDK